jgi:hypothetical protein
MISRTGVTINNSLPLSLFRVLLFPGDVSIGGYIDERGDGGFNQCRAMCEMKEEARRSVDVAMLRIVIFWREKAFLRGNNGPP